MSLSNAAVIVSTLNGTLALVLGLIKLNDRVRNRQTNRE